jgi:integrase/recombinase XerC
LKRYSKETLKSYKHDLNSFDEFIKSIHEKDNSLLNVNKEDIKAFIGFLSEKKFSNRSINRKIACLKSFYKFLQKIHKISYDPLELITSLRIKKEIQVPFSKEEMQNLLNHLENFTNDFIGRRDSLIIEFLYYTGIRKNELTTLEIKNINLKENILKIKGKGNKERIIPIHEKLSQKILIYLEERKDFLKAKEHDFLIVSKKGQKPYDKLIYNVVHTYLGKVSTKLKKSPHMIRHTFATHLLEMGADLNAIKEILGHSNLASTQIYTHTSMKYLKEVYQNFHPKGDKRKKD